VEQQTEGRRPALNVGGTVQQAGAQIEHKVEEGRAPTPYIIQFFVSRCILGSFQHPHTSDSIFFSLGMWTHTSNSFRASKPSVSNWSSIICLSYSKASSFLDQLQHSIMKIALWDLSTSNCVN
jgi:hypothetical protein